MENKCLIYPSIGKDECPIYPRHQIISLLPFPCASMCVRNKENTPEVGIGSEVGNLVKIDDKEDTSQRKYDIVQWGSMYQNQFEVISARYIDIKLCHIYLTSFLHARFIASQKAVW